MLGDSASSKQLPQKGQDGHTNIRLHNFRLKMCYKRQKSHFVMIKGYLNKKNHTPKLMNTQ